MEAVPSASPLSASITSHQSHATPCITITSSSHAPWKLLQGTRRIQAELKHLHRELHSFPCVKSVHVADDLCVWQLQLWNFDDSLPGGRMLNADLQLLKAR